MGPIILEAYEWNRRFKGSYLSQSALPCYSKLISEVYKVEFLVFWELESWKIGKQSARVAKEYALVYVCFCRGITCFYFT